MTTPLMLAPVADNVPAIPTPPIAKNDTMSGTLPFPVLNLILPLVPPPAFGFKIISFPVASILR